MHRRRRHQLDGHCVRRAAGDHVDRRASEPVDSGVYHDVDVDDLLDDHHDRRRSSRPIRSRSAWRRATRSPTRVILWTRLLPADPLPDTDVDVEWEVATDAEFTDVVAVRHQPSPWPRSATRCTSTSPDWSPTPSTTTGSASPEFATPAARTRTFAAPGTTPERFRFAFSSCQNWEQRLLRRLPRPRRAGRPRRVRVPRRLHLRERRRWRRDPRARTTGQDFECETIEQYRERYALYKSDPLLQAAHALVPWVITWDDHEVDNDYAERAASTTTRATRSSPAVPPATRPGTSTCRCASTHRAGPTTTSTARSRHGDLRALPRARHPSVPGRPAARRTVRRGAR